MNIKEHMYEMMKHIVQDQVDIQKSVGKHLYQKE